MSGNSGQQPAVFHPGLLRLILSTPPTAATTHILTSSPAHDHHRASMEHGTSSSWAGSSAQSSSATPRHHNGEAGLESGNGSDGGSNETGTSSPSPSGKTHSPPLEKRVANLNLSGTVTSQDQSSGGTRHSPAASCGVPVPLDENGRPCIDTNKGMFLRARDRHNWRHRQCTCTVQ